MLVFKHRDDYSAWRKAQTRPIAFVPTMGALHAGHISLIEMAKTKAELTVCSIYVNPTQFNNADDFARYPIQLSEDYRQLIDAGTDVLFLPDTQEMYPEGLTQTHVYPIGYLDTVLDGAMRPGHFQGVCRIVHKLLNIIEPHTLLLGRKDYQQCLVIQQLIEQEQLPVDVVFAPTARAEDGLALSSRNQRLSDEARAIAPQLYQVLLRIEGHIQMGIPFEQAQQEALQQLQQLGFTPEYILLAQADNLCLLQDATPDFPMVLLAAAWLDGVRLIDNIPVSIS
ncbi:MAG: pantoate--beta-alanine ligase [Chitinophagaceae bacterium]